MERGIVYISILEMEVEYGYYQFWISRKRRLGNRKTTRRKSEEKQNKEESEKYNSRTGSNQYSLDE